MIFKKILPIHTKLFYLLLLALAGGVFLWTQPAYANRLFSTGFELNDTLATPTEFEVPATTGLSISSTTVRSGTYSLRQNSATASYIQHQWRAANGDDRVYIRFYFRITTLHTSGDATLLDIKDSSNATRASIRMNSSGNLKLYNATVQAGSNSYALSTGTWYMVEMEFNSLRAAGADTLKARLNGTTFASSAAESLSTVQRFWLGNCAGTTGTPDFFFDDVAINDINGESNSFPGPGKIIYLRPNAEGDNATGSRGGADSGSNWGQVDEVTPNDATDYYILAVNNILDVNIDAASTGGIGASDKITLVQVGARITGGQGQAATYNLRIKSAASGNVLAGTSIGLGTTTWYTHDDAVPRNYTLTAYRIPTGNEWTAAFLDSTQIGITSTLRATWVTALWAVVEYVPASEDDGASGGDAGGTYAGGQTLAGKGEVQGYLNSAGDVDYYLFSVTNGNRYEVVLTPAPGKNYDVDIRNASDTSKATGTSSGDTEEIVKFTADATATWAVKVASAGTDYDATHPYTMSVHDANYYYVRQDGSGGQKNGDPTNAAQCFSTLSGALTQMKTDYSNKISNQGKVFISVRDITAAAYASVTLDGLTTDIDGILVLENYSTEAPVINGTTATAIYVGNAAQTDGNVTNLIVKGLTLKSNLASYSTLLFDGTNIISGSAVIKNNIFDGQTTEVGTSINMIRAVGNSLTMTIKNNEFMNFYDDVESGPAVTVRRSDTTYNPTVTLVGNSFHDNRAGAILYLGYANTGSSNFTVERNQFYTNRSPSSSTQTTGMILLCNINAISALVVQNNFIYSNDWSYVTNHTIIQTNYGSNSKIYNNTLYANKASANYYADIYIELNSTQGVAVKNNLIAPTPGSNRYAINVALGAETNFISANNAFYVDYGNDGYPAGSTWSTSENTENIGNWAGTLKTTSTWNAISNNTGNGFTLGGPGVTSSSDMHITSSSLCKDQGVTLASNPYDYDRDTRPSGAAYDIGGDEYISTVTPTRRIIFIY